MPLKNAINKLPEVIKCIIFDYVSIRLNYEIELCSDKFIGNPIDTYPKIVYIPEPDEQLNVSIFYHTNKLTGIKNYLHFIGLFCVEFPPQEIINKLQKLFIIHRDHDIQYNLPCIKNLTICGKLKNIPHIVGLLKLNCSGCINLTEIPHIKGLLKLDCSWCPKLIKIPHIVGLLELYCNTTTINEIPNIVGLQKLHCSECNQLTKIPHIVGLQELNCAYCCNIIEIPGIIGLKKLDYVYCISLSKIPDIIGLQIFRYVNNMWIFVSKNLMYYF